MDSLVARQHLILLTSDSQPVQSGHLSTDVIQLCQRVVQQNPFSQGRHNFLQRRSEGNQSVLHQLLWKGLLCNKNIAKNYVGTHRRTREFSPEKVKEDIWWMLLFSRILHQKKRIKSFSLICRVDQVETDLHPSASGSFQPKTNQFIHKVKHPTVSFMGRFIFHLSF